MKVRFACIREFDLRREQGPCCAGHVSMMLQGKMKDHIYMFVDDVVTTLVMNRQWQMAVARGCWYRQIYDTPPQGVGSW